MIEESGQTATEGTGQPVEVSENPGPRPLPASNALQLVTTSQDLDGQALEGEVVDGTKEAVQDLMTRMHKVGKRYPFNLLVASWRLTPGAWAAIRRHHNPTTVWITDGDRKTIWGIPVRLDDDLDSIWTFELVTHGAT